MASPSRPPSPGAVHAGHRHQLPGRGPVGEDLQQPAGVPLADHRGAVGQHHQAGRARRGRSRPRSGRRPARRRCRGGRPGAGTGALLRAAPTSGGAPSGHGAERAGGVVAAAAAGQQQAAQGHGGHRSGERPRGPHSPSAAHRRSQYVRLRRSGQARDPCHESAPVPTSSTLGPEETAARPRAVPRPRGGGRGDLPAGPRRTASTPADGRPPTGEAARAQIWVPRRRRRRAREVLEALPRAAAGPAAQRRGGEVRRPAARAACCCATPAARTRRRPRSGRSPRCWPRSAASRTSSASRTPAAGRSRTERLAGRRAGARWSAPATSARTIGRMLAGSTSSSPCGPHRPRRRARPSTSCPSCCRTPTSSC